MCSTALVTCSRTAAASLDAICDGGLPGIGLPGVPGLPGIPGLPNVGDLFGGGIPGLGDIPNPFDELGDVIAKAAADAWTAAMLAVWNSGLFVLRIVLTFSELFLTPDLRADGPGRDVYAFTLWLALALVVILALIQLGAAAFKREGKGLARAFIGAGQFVLVCACWFGYCVMIVAACGAITRALMKSLLKVQTWPDWDPLGGLGIDDITDGRRGHRARPSWASSCGWPRSGTSWSISPGRPRCWCWPPPARSRRPGWSPTSPAPGSGRAALVPRRGVHPGADGDGAGHRRAVRPTASPPTSPTTRQKAIGTALPAVMLILISVVAPLALFKLLAFVDPGTPPARRSGRAWPSRAASRACSAAAVPAAARRPRRPRDGNGRSAVSRAPRPRPATGSTSPPRASSAASARSGRRWRPARAGQLRRRQGHLPAGGRDQPGRRRARAPTAPTSAAWAAAASPAASPATRAAAPTPASQNSGDDDSPLPTPPAPPTPPTCPPTLPTGGGPGGGSGGQGGGGAGAAPKTPAAGGGGGAAGGAGGAGAAGGAIPPVAV